MSTKQKTYSNEFKEEADKNAFVVETRGNGGVVYLIGDL